MYRSRQWQATRKAILERDNWRCRKCSKAGLLEVDHIRPIRAAGDWYDEKNLWTLCRGCHIAKTREENRSRVISPARKLLMEMAYGQS